MQRCYRKVLILLVLVFTSAWAGPRAETLWGIPFSTPEHNRPHCASRAALDEDSLHRFDGVAYEADILLRPDASTISATVLLRLTTTDPGVSELYFRFTESLTLDSVWADGANQLQSYAHVGDDSLRLEFSAPLQILDTVTVGFMYHGTPATIDEWGGLHFGAAAGYRPLIGWSMGDGLALDPPPSNYNWLPTWADPTDKVSWDCWISGYLTQHTNGHLVEVVEGDSGLTNRHYVLEQPVSTYLLFIASSDFRELVQRDSLPRIANWVYPSRESQALSHFSNVPACLDGFVERFGPYPFRDFGFMMTRAGDMEHATCVAHLDQIVQANHNYDQLLFHELSHMWWGDWVTLGDWRDLWLNEGFATYCEALGKEILGGHQAYISYVVNDLMPDARSATDSYSIYDPDYYWGATVYQKGGCVLHMLRNVMGDSLFFQAWRDYGNEHAFGNAVTADFQAKCEQVYGEDLDWFFQPWVYGTRYPRYRVNRNESDVQVFTIEQIQSTETLFRMPVDVVAIINSGDTLRDTRWVEATRDPQVIWDTFHDPLADTLWIDPDNKILKTVLYERTSAANEKPHALPAQFEVSSIYPNPFNASATLTYELPAPSRLTLSVFEVTGRLVDHLNLDEQSAGSHQLSWDGSNYSTGIYFFTLSTQHSASTVKALLLK